MVIPGRLIIRTYAPVRRWLVLLALALLVLLSLYLAYEFGHYQAGFDGIEAAQERARLQDRIDELSATLKEQRVQMAAAAAQQTAQVRERAEVARTIGELQADVARQQQELEFYRGLALPQGAAASAAPVRVQQFQVEARDEAARQYVLRFSLNRLVRPEEQIAGQLAIMVDGERNASAASIDLAALTGGATSLVAFNFRYFASIEQPITLPAGFRPQRVTIEVRPGRKGVAPYRQTFVWAVEGR
ncbi:MAG: hypothetical protein IT480_16430 [Gammaproteobacteria bacterium]|nr:hypothetical protein [Gammaproteobacteria bacterium]